MRITSASRAAGTASGGPPHRYDAGGDRYDQPAHPPGPRLLGPRATVALVLWLGAWRRVTNGFLDATWGYLSPHPGAVPLALDALLALGQSFQSRRSDVSS